MPNIQLEHKYRLSAGVEFINTDHNLWLFDDPNTCATCEVELDAGIAKLIFALDGKMSLAESLRKSHLGYDIITSKAFLGSFGKLLEDGYIYNESTNPEADGDETRYHRNNLLSLQHLNGMGGREMLFKLKSSTIAIIGLGGTASPLIHCLAGSGIGCFKLIDHDRVDESNLPRQTIYRYSDRGRKKTEAAQEYIQGQNPFTRVESLELTIKSGSEDSLARFISDCNLIVNTADEPDIISVLSIIQAVCFRLSIPFMGGSSYNGFIPPLVVPGKSTCFDCLLLQYKNDRQVRLPGKRSRERDFMVIAKEAIRLPYHILMERNSYVAGEIIAFLLGIASSGLENRFYAPPEHLVPRMITKQGQCDTCQKAFLVHN